MEVQMHSEKYSENNQIIKFPFLLNYINGLNNLLLTLN